MITSNPFASYLSTLFPCFAGFEWVGWSNDSVGVPGKAVELTFQFDSVRNFSAMVLHTNNMFTKGVQVSDKVNLLKTHQETV